MADMTCAGSWWQGFLMKRGRINPVFKRRWFVLSGSRMLWYSK